MDVDQLKEDSNQGGPLPDRGAAEAIQQTQTPHFNTAASQLTLNFTPSPNAEMAPRPEANALPRAVSLSPTELSEESETSSVKENDSDVVDLTDKDEPRRSKRAKKSTLVYINGQPVLAKNNYEMKGLAYQYGTDFETAPKAKKKKAASKPKNGPTKPRKVTSQEKKRTDHNKAVLKRIESKKERRAQFLASNLSVMEPFLEEKVAAKLRKAVPKTTIPDKDPELYLQPEAIQSDMRDYQLAGLNWMVKMYESNLPCILGDEMGLGKTLQTISLLCHLKERDGVSGPSLVICPLSVLYSWCNELERWAPSLKFLRLHSSSAEEREGQKQSFQEKATEYDVVITTYEMAKSLGLRSLWTRMHFNMLVLDEGHKIKDATNQISQAVRLIHCENKLILTGTPLQNNLIELHALLNFLYPDVFVSNDRFAEAFDLVENVIDKEKLLEAHSLLGLFMLRRLKTEVEKLMPKKVETKVICPLSSTQIYWYKALLMKDINLLARTNGDENATSAATAKYLSNLMMQLRKCCLHPFLFDGAEVDIESTTCEDLVAASGKLAVLDMLLRSLYEKKHRVVLFSQFTSVLDILDDYCTMRGFKHCRFDGSTARAKRNHIVNQFNAEGSDFFVFLMSTRSGGMGLNLQTADTCILFDSDWNPQPDLQAMARVHRIGQKKTVHVYRLVCGGTIEERMVERAQQKLYLDQMVNQDSIVGIDGDEELGGVSKGELLATLKFGCDAVFGGDAENQNALPTLEDIDIITDRNRSETMDDGKMKGAISTAADFKADEKLTSTTKLGGIDFKEIRDQHKKARAKDGPKDIGGIADTWIKLQKRNRRNRIVQVQAQGSGYGSTSVPVLAANNYELENGESSVFQRELSHSKGSYGQIKRKVKKSGVDFESQDFCQVCGDGGLILCCPRCPVCVHTECVGVDDPKNFLSCPHHRCSECNKNIQASGGLLYPCQSCPLSFCEDCLPANEMGFRILDVADRFNEMGFHSKHLCYIHCSAKCEEYAKAEFNWSPPSSKRPSVPPALDVSHAFGTQVDANIDDAPSEEIVESRLRKRKAVNYTNMDTTDHSMATAQPPLPSPKKAAEDPDFAIDETMDDESDDGDDDEYEEEKEVRVSKANIVPAVSSYKAQPTDCYDVVFPCTEHGYLFVISKQGDEAVFSGYSRTPDGHKGPAELANRVRRVGDRVIAVNRVDVTSCTFQEIISVLTTTKASMTPIVVTFREAQGAQISKSKYSAANIRNRIAHDGSIAPASQPKKDHDGLYIRPAGRPRTGMAWDAVRGCWVRLLDSFGSMRAGYNASEKRTSYPPDVSTNKENVYSSKDGERLATSKSVQETERVPSNQASVTTYDTAEFKPPASLKRKAEEAVIDLTSSGNDRPAKQTSKPKEPPIETSTSLSPLIEEEYEVSVPVTNHGLLLEVGKTKNHTAVLGYRRAPGGVKGPAEIGNLIRQSGDRIVAVNKTDVSNMDYIETVNALVAAQTNASNVVLRLRTQPPQSAESTQLSDLSKSHDPTKLLDPPATDEYDVCIPKTSRGLMIRVGDLFGSPVFIEYRRGPLGEKGPAEMNQMIRNAGDRLVAVNGILVNSYHQAIGLIQENRNAPATHLRFREPRDVDANEAK